MPYFVKVVLVELSNETGKVAVFEVLGQDVLGKLLILRSISDRSSPTLEPLDLEDDKTIAFISPANDALVLRCFQHLVQLAHLQYISAHVQLPDQ